MKSTISLNVPHLRNRTGSMYQRFLIGLLALTFLRQLLYIAITPPFQGPDEPGHFEYVALLYRLGRIPASRPNTEHDPELTRAINAAAREQNFEHYHPGVSLRRLSEQEPPLLAGPREAGYQHPIYYLLLLPVYALFSHQGVLVQYYALVITSSLLAVVVVLLAGLLARELFPTDHFAQMAMPLLVAFWPTQTFMMSRLNNDNLATFLGALTIFVLVTVLKIGLTSLSGLGLLSLAILASITKGTTLFLLPLIGLTLVLRLSQHWSAERRRQLSYIAAGTGLLGLAALVAVFFFPPAADVAAKLMQTAPWASVRAWGWLTAAVTVLSTGQHWQAERLTMNWLEFKYILQGFWAAFGWGRLRLEPSWYWGVGLAIGLAGVGLLVSVRQRLWQTMPEWKLQAFMLSALSFVLAWVPLMTRMIIDPFAVWWHGRSLLPTLLPVSALLTLGFTSLTPKRARTMGAQVLLLALLLMDTASLAWTLVPYYYQ